MVVLVRKVSVTNLIHTPNIYFLKEDVDVYIKKRISWKIVLRKGRKIGNRRVDPKMKKLYIS